MIIFEFFCGFFVMRVDYPLPHRNCNSRYVKIAVLTITESSDVIYKFIRKITTTTFFTFEFM